MEEGEPKEKQELQEELVQQEQQDQRVPLV
jgi:hypothetical protein